MLEEEEDCAFGDLFGVEEVPPPEVLTPIMYTRPSGKGTVMIMISSQRHSLWGHMLWHAAEEMADRLDQMDLSNKSVLELGAGMGLPGIVCSLAGAARVVVTDYDDEALLRGLNRNAQQNCPLQLDHGLLTITGLTWGTYSHIQKVLELNGGRRFDVIILSDLVFNHVCHDALAITVKECLAKNGHALCTFTHHRVHKIKEDMNLFERAFPKVGLRSEALGGKRYTVMFQDDVGDEEIRSTVHSYKITHDLCEYIMDPITDRTFDVIVEGTNTGVSLVAGAIARAGLKILHVDNNDFYGGEARATLTWRQFRKYALMHDWDEVVHRDPTVFGERQYNIDLLPSVLYADGEVVQFLTRSGLCRYLEFTKVDRLVIFLKSERNESTSTTLHRLGNFCSVPLSKGELFRAKNLSLAEKRCMMKALTSLSSESSDIKPADELLSNYLKQQSMPTRLSQWLQYVILECDELTIHTMTLGKAAERLRTFLASVGKYSPTPYITYMYGSGELSQACCRVGALYNGTYALRQHVENIHSSLSPETRERGRLTVQIGPPNVDVYASHFVTSTAQEGIQCSRCFILLRRPLVTWKELEENGDVPMNDDGTPIQYSDDDAPVAVITFPPGIFNALPEHVVKAMQVTASTHAVPQGVWGIHFVTHAPLNALKQAIKHLLQTTILSYDLIYEAYWLVNQELHSSPKEEVPGVHHVAPRDAFILHDDELLSSATEIFQSVLNEQRVDEKDPDASLLHEFYPKLPNPCGTSELLLGPDEVTTLLGIDENIIKDRLAKSISSPQMND